VACGAAYARVEYPHVKKIVVVDFDVHHGNGTEDILGGDEETMFLSLQRHGGNFFPCLSGETSVCGNVCNVGLPEGYDSEVFRKEMNRAILPKIYGFRPDLILISAGFDGHSSDPIGGAKLETHDFAWATAEIMKAAKEHCDGKVVSCLEGGYNAKNADTGLAACIASHVKALCGLDEAVAPKPEEDTGDSALGAMMMGGEPMDEEGDGPSSSVKIEPPKTDLPRQDSGMSILPPGSPARDLAAPLPGGGGSLAGGLMIPSGNQISMPAQFSAPAVQAPPEGACDGSPTQPGIMSPLSAARQKATMAQVGANLAGSLALPGEPPAEPVTVEEKEEEKAPGGGEGQGAEPMQTD